MGMKVSKTAIGAFVIGAIVLLVAGVLVLGAGKFFVTEHTYITYFDGSVKGLNVGSPVTFRGVKIGEVKSISITLDRATHLLEIPVVFSLEPSKIEGTKALFQQDPRAIEEAVTRYGLRTQLQSLSFVTGQLMVALDFFPGTKPSYVGLNKNYPEIPSVPTPLEELRKTLEDLPLKDIVRNLNDTLVKVKVLVGSIDGKKTSESVLASLKELQILLKNANTRVERLDPLVTSLTDTSEKADATLVEAKNTLADLRGHLDSLSKTTQDTLQKTQATLDQSQKTLQSFSADSRLQADLSRALRELAAASRSLRNLSDYLERHPESVIRGKGDKGE